MTKKWSYILVLLLLFVSEYSSAAEDQIRAYTIDELMDQARHKNFNIRANAEQLYRTRHQVKVAMGRVIPGLNLGAVVAVLKFDYYDLAAQLLGFAFPSNWFRWRESKLYFQAHRRQFATLIANEVNGVQSLALRIYSYRVLEQIFIKRLGDIEKVVAKAQMRLEVGEDTSDIVLIFDNMRLKILHDLQTIQNEYRNMLNILAAQIDFGVDRNWQLMVIKDFELPNLENSTPLNPDDYLATVWDRSLELESFVFLKKAAKYAKYSRVFEFLSVDYEVDSNFGFGYLSYVKIGKSKQRELAVREQEMKVNLKSGLRQAINDINISFKLYDTSNKGLKNAEHWFEILIAKYFEGGEYEPSDYINALSSLLSFETRVAQAQIYYLISKAQLDRLTWSHQYYRDLLKDLTPKKKGKKGKDHQQGRGGFIERFMASIKRKWEDNEIEKDIKDKKLILPDEA